MRLRCVEASKTIEMVRHLTELKPDLKVGENERQIL
jgi:hypothetical protein